MNDVAQESEWQKGQREKREHAAAKVAELQLAIKADADLVAKKIKALSEALEKHRSAATAVETAAHHAGRADLAERARRATEKGPQGAIFFAGTAAIFRVRNFLLASCG